MLVWSVLALSVVAGCAQMEAAGKLGANNGYYRGRVLESGTADYNEYFSLQKVAFPRWSAVIAEHGNPDYILPSFGSYCRMVWISEGLTGNPTVFDTISLKKEIPTEVASAQARRKRLEESKLADAKGKVFKIESLQYDDASRRGTIVVRVDDGDFANARIWTLTYVENLAKDKNVAIRTGEKRSETMYLLRDEKIDGKMLTINFETM